MSIGSNLQVDHVKVWGRLVKKEDNNNVISDYYSGRELKKFS